VLDKPELTLARGSYRVVYNPRRLQPYTVWYRDMVISFHENKEDAEAVTKQARKVYQ